MLIGYARVSKTDGSQSLGLQRDALRVVCGRGRNPTFSGSRCLVEVHGPRPGGPEPLAGRTGWASRRVSIGLTNAERQRRWRERRNTVPVQERRPAPGAAAAEAAGLGPEAWRDQLPESLADSRDRRVPRGRLRRRRRRPPVPTCGSTTLVMLPADRGLACLRVVCGRGEIGGRGDLSLATSRQTSGSRRAAAEPRWPAGRAGDQGAAASRRRRLEEPRPPTVGPPSIVSPARRHLDAGRRCPARRRRGSWNVPSVNPHP